MYDSSGRNSFDSPRGVSRKHSGPTPHTTPNDVHSQQLIHAIRRQSGATTPTPYHSAVPSGQPTRYHHNSTRNTLDNPGRSAEVKDPPSYYDLVGETRRSAPVTKPPVTKQRPDLRRYNAITRYDVLSHF